LVNIKSPKICPRPSISDLADLMACRYLIDFYSNYIKDVKKDDTLSYEVKSHIIEFILDDIEDKQAWIKLYESKISGIIV